MIDNVRGLLQMCFCGCQARIESERTAYSNFEKYWWKMKSVRLMTMNKVEGITMKTFKNLTIGAQIKQKN